MAKKPGKANPRSRARKGDPVSDPSKRLASTAELVGDGANPRRISDDAAEGLKKSLARFGDLSGIVFNQRTGELVTGHQRMAQVRAEYGEREIEAIDEAAGLYGIRVDAEHFFPVRVVDWTKAKQRAANVAANNAKLQGTFTAELSTYLLSVEADPAEEMPGVMEDCLLVELMAARLDLSDATESEEVEFEAQDVPDVYQVVVDCETEEEQKKLYDQLVDLGYKPKLLTV